jgi:S1-C subfamily serine protease
MAHTSSITRRALLIAAVLLAMTAALGFSQSAPKDSSNATPGHPSQPGVLVVSVQSGSPAEKAGIARGDIILDVNGTAVNTQADMRQAVASHKAGDTITLKVRHGDAEKTLTVALGAMEGHAYVGVLLFPEGQERMGMRDNTNKDWPWISQGVIVARVASGSPADKAGLKRGDVILSVDGVFVDTDHSLSALIQQKKSGDTVTLSVQSGWPQTDKGPRDVKVTLGNSPDKKVAWLGVSYREGFPVADLIMPWDGQRGFMVPDFTMPGLTAPEPTAASV